MESSSSKPIHPYLPASKGQYWVWGLPSLVLAIATVIIAVVSQWIVEPQISLRYQKILDAAIKDLDSNSENKDLAAWKGRELKLKEATLAAKRLIASSPLDPSPKWQLAQLEWAAAEQYRYMAMTEAPIPNEEATTRAQKETWLERSRASMMRAWNELRDASRLEGVDAQQASLRLMRRALDSYAQAPPGKMDLSELAAEVADNVSAPELAAERDRLLGRIQVQRGLDVFSNQPADSIRDTLQQAEQLLKPSSPSDSGDGDTTSATSASIDELWLAECIGWTDPTAAQAVARRFISTWVPKLNSSKQGSIEGMEAVSRAFVLLDNPQEASASLATRLSSLTPDEQAEARMRLAATILRRLVPLACDRSQTSKVDATQWLRMALQVAPDSPRVTAFLRKLIDRESEIPAVARILSEDTRDQDRKPLFVVLDMLSPRLNDDVTPEQVASLGPAGLTSALASVLLQNFREGSLDYEIAQSRLQMMTEQFPNSPDVWMSKALIAVQSGNLPTALDALNRLKELTPGNTRVEQLLRETQERASSMVSPP